MFDNKALPVAEGGTGVTSYESYFYAAYDVTDYVLDNQTIAAGAAKELTYNYGMAGPSILAGWYLSNATSSGQNVSNVTVYGAYINDDGDKFVIKCKNTGSSTAKVKATFRAFRVR